MEITIRGRWGLTVLLTNERAESSYGIPVAIFNGKAYGALDHFPGKERFPDCPELEWLAAEIPVGREIFAWVYDKHGDNHLSPEEERFLDKFSAPAFK